MTNRQSDIDTARAILITLVVVAHILNYTNPGYDILPYTLLQEFIGTFHMPAFFLLSGMLTDPEKWQGRTFRTYLLRRAQKLLIPYVFFECLAILYKHFILRSVTLTEGLQLMLTLRCNVGADWFLPAMFLACLLYWCYLRFPRRALWGVVGAGLLVLLHFMPTGHLWSLLFRAVLGFVFMLAGNLLKKFLRGSFRWWQTGLAFFLTALIAAICFKCGIRNSFYDGVLQGSVLFLAGGLCGLIAVLGFARCIPWKWPTVIGQNALTIMGTHQLVLYSLTGNSSPLWVAGVFLLIAAIEAVLIIIVNRICPPLVGQTRKDRSHA